MSNEPHDMFLQDYIKQLIDKKAIVNIHNNKIDLTGQIKEVYILNSSSYMVDATEPDIMTENYEPLVTILFEVDSINNFNNVSDKVLKKIKFEVDAIFKCFNEIVLDEAIINEENNEDAEIRKQQFEESNSYMTSINPKYTGTTPQKLQKLNFKRINNYLTHLEGILNNIKKLPTTILLQIHLHDTIISELHYQKDDVLIN